MLVDLILTQKPKYEKNVVIYVNSEEALKT